MTPTNPTDAQMKRIMKARETPYDGGIWEGRKLNKEPFVTIRLSDLDALLAIQATEARAQVLVEFQQRVQPWMMECFGATIAADQLERSDRFIEEALELVQACGYSADRAHALVDYVFGRPIGEPSQEVGGVMVTLAALCLAAGLNMHEAGEAELARINQPDIITKIRAKHAAKPTGSALPIAIKHSQHGGERER